MRKEEIVLRIAGFLWRKSFTRDEFSDTISSAGILNQASCAPDGTRSEVCFASSKTSDPYREKTMSPNHVADDNRKPTTNQ